MHFFWRQQVAPPRDHPPPPGRQLSIRRGGSGVTGVICHQVGSKWPINHQPAHFSELSWRVNFWKRKRTIHSRDSRGGLFFCMTPPSQTTFNFPIWNLLHFSKSHQSRVLLVRAQTPLLLYNFFFLFFFIPAWHFNYFQSKGTYLARSNPVDGLSRLIRHIIFFFFNWNIIFSFFKL